MEGWKILLATADDYTCTNMTQATERVKSSTPYFLLQVRTPRRGYHHCYMGTEQMNMLFRPQLLDGNLSSMCGISFSLSLSFTWKHPPNPLSPPSSLSLSLSLSLPLPLPLPLSLSLPLPLPHTSMQRYGW